MRNLRICYLANIKSIHVKRWVDYFAQRGHDVHLISFLPHTEYFENAKIHYVKTLQGRIRLVPYIADPLLAFIQLQNLLRKINPDILHAHYVWDKTLSRVLMNFHPFIISAWGTDVFVIPKKSRIYRLITAAALNKADIITTTAVYMGEYLQKEFNIPEKKIMRIPWGIDLTTFHRGYTSEVKALKNKLSIPDGSPVIISSRHMTPLYNIHSLVEAASHVIKDHPEAVFIFLRGYGSPEFEGALKSKAETWGVSQNIRFISQVLTPEQMAIYLNASDIFISIPLADQFASSIMEGMACGIIPIVSDIDVYTQYLTHGENAFFVDPSAPEQIAETISYCIEHLHLKEAMYTINKKIIHEEEDWSKNAQKMEALYTTLQEG
jgi:glycosyltransferase involved in cell wall biosynthesis